MNVVPIRSQTKRLLRISLLAPFGAALILSFIVGCQSNSQQDLVARELRMQEDQIYAMEDYLAQYQQLICKYRTENAALKQQLAADGPGEPLPNRQPPRSRNGRPSVPNAPELDIPAAPDPKNAPSQIDDPDVPPLEGTGSRRGTDRAGELAGGVGRVVPAVAIEQTDQLTTIQDVWLHGEVVENETGGGPRVVVHIEPRDANGTPTKFSGRLSLMLLAPNSQGERQPLARWDFAPEDVRMAQAGEATQATISFHLELEVDTPLIDATQLWVRLLPNHHDKVISFAEIDLAEPGTFSSFPRAPSPIASAERRTTVATDRETLPLPIVPIARTNRDEAGWSIARPDDPANLDSNTGLADSQWRASSEPMPVVMAHSSPTRPKRVHKRRATRPRKSEPAVSDTRGSIAWSPERPRDSTTSTAGNRPLWSATR